MKSGKCVWIFYCISGAWLALSVNHCPVIFSVLLFQLKLWVCNIIDCATSLEVFVGCQSGWLTHWGRVMHICVSSLTIIGSDNSLSPSRHQAIIWTNTGILLMGPLGTNFNEILIVIDTFSFKKMYCKNIRKMAAILSRPQYVKAPCSPNEVLTWYSSSRQLSAAPPPPSWGFVGYIIGVGRIGLHLR